MLGTALQNLLRDRLFQVPTQNIGVMPIFSIIDLPMMAVIPPRKWFETISYLRTFQKNLKRRDWPSLASIYPRTYMWTYAYTLFAWGRYCGILPVILANPERSLFAEIFLRYICQIDQYVDSFDSRELMQTHPAAARRHPPVQNVALELCAHLRSLDIPQPTKRTLARLTVEFRSGYLRSLRRSPESLPEVMHDKERTAGNLWRIWTRLLGCLYAVPDRVAQSASEVYFHLGMMIQVMDDLSDAPTDYRLHTQNMLLTIACTIPQDWAQIEQRFASDPATHIHWGWLRRTIPTSYQETMKLYDHYKGRLLNDQCNPQVALELYQMIESMRRLAR